MTANATAEAEKPRSAAHKALRSFGITRPSETPLLLPQEFEDFTEPCVDLSLMSEGELVLIACEVTSRPSRSSSGPPRYSFTLKDKLSHTYRAAVFGDDPRVIEGVAAGSTVPFLAKAKDRNGTRWITCTEVIEPQWLGRIRPVYPVRKAGGLRTQIRQIIHGYLPHMVGKAGESLREQLADLADMPTLLCAVGCPGWSIDDLLWQIHAPSNMIYAEHARRAYLRLAALGARFRAMQRAILPPIEALVLTTLPTRVASLKFKLTDDQKTAVDEMAQRLAQTQPARSILSGEVGTGKSLVAFILMVCVTDLSRGRVLLMAPTFPLATQLHRDFTAMFPEVPTSFVAGDGDGSDPRASRAIIGTSAALTRDVGEFNLVIVDEQQRWSRAQREKYVSGNTHLIEMTATCIPRTQALIRLGHVTVSEMRQTHAPKTIHTSLHVGHEGAGSMFRQIRAAVALKRPVLVIYPKKDADDESVPDATVKTNASAGIDQRHSIESAIPRWEKIFPGRIRAITGDNENVDKQSALQDIMNGHAEVLLATTVVEVGISLPNLYYIVIVHPDRYGLTTLHQLRGRVARNGGEGHCFLWAPEPLAPKAQERLDIFVSTNDGFALAEADMRLRGTGDLSADSNSQSGADETFLFGAPLSIEVLDEVGPILDQLTSKGALAPDVAADARSDTHDAAC